MFFIHKFIRVFYKSFLIPLLISMFFLYILKPLNNIFIKKGLKRELSSLLTLVISLFILLGIGSHFSKYILREFSDLIKNITNITAVTENKNSMNFILNEFYKYINISEVYETIKNILKDYIKNIGLLKGINYIIDTFSKVLLLLVILFFLLKDGTKFKNKFISIFPEKYEEFLSNVFSDSDNVLTSYVTGQVKVALSLGIMIFIGYKVIGIPNALILSSLTFILGFIPFVGFFISMIVPFIIALGMGFTMLLKLAAVFIIVQTLKGRIVVPSIMAHAMKIHPLTDIFLVIGAVSLGGPMAAFTIVPIYGIFKAILINLYKFKSKDC